MSRLTSSLGFGDSPGHDLTCGQTSVSVLSSESRAAPQRALSRVKMLDMSDRVLTSGKKREQISSVWARKRLY